MPTHTTDDSRRLAYSIDGPVTAPPLILSSSLGTDRSLWDRQIEALAERFRVLRYDTRGHGESDAPSGDYTIDRLGRDVLSLMDDAGFARAHICGISLGGMTALWLGAHAAHRVNRLVLANTAGRIGAVDLWTERMAVAANQGMESLAESAMSRWFTPSFHAAEPQAVAHYRGVMARMRVSGYVGCCAALRDADLRAVAPQVHARGLVVTGVHDVSTPPAEGEWLARTIPEAQLLALDAAHLSNLERAHEFTDAVQSFLTST